MTSSLLFRSTFDLQPAEGRTLVGTAMPWDHPTMVRDLTGPAYLEEFAATSCDVAIRNKPQRPVFISHEYKFVPAAEPVGTVTFARSDEGLLFEAPLSKTRRADEMLELVNDGAMRSVSVGFTPIQNARRQHLGQQLVTRTEVGLRELSLCPTGFGQYEEAGVLSVRGLGGDPTFNAIREAVQAALERKAFGEDGERPNGTYLWIRDIASEWAVYELQQDGEDCELYRVAYTVTGDDVELDEPEPVEVSYTPLERADLVDMAAAAARARSVRDAELRMLGLL